MHETDAEEQSTEMEDNSENNSKDKSEDIQEDNGNSKPEQVFWKASEKLKPPITS